MRNKDDFASLKRGLEQAAAYQQGAREGYTVHEAEDMRTICAASGKAKQTSFNAAKRIRGK